MKRYVLALRFWQCVERVLPMRWLAHRYVDHDDERAFDIYCWVHDHLTAAEFRSAYYD